MKHILKFSIASILATAFLSSCASYKYNIMYKVPEDAVLQQVATDVQRNYVIQKNDYLKLDVYTNKGELIIDPDFELRKEIPNQNNQVRQNPDYLVDIKGVAKFPMIGELKVDGLTIREAEAIIQKEYTKFYAEPFVILTYSNKRVVVLGSTGGKVIPLTNENVTLSELLALAGGLDNNSKAQNIRVLRGNDFFVADLSTIDGYRKFNMILQPDDIVYVEPIRRPASEAVRDYGAIISMLISVTTLIIVITTL